MQEKQLEKQTMVQDVASPCLQKVQPDWEDKSNTQAMETIKRE